MKAELITTIQIFLILIFLIGIISYAITYFKNNVKKFDYNFIKKIYTKSLEYSRLMIIENYISYEKYDVWRYCTKFKMK